MGDRPSHRNEETEEDLRIAKARGELVGKLDTVGASVEGFLEGGELVGELDTVGALAEGLDTNADEGTSGLRGQ
jgi:hypothetical protein